MNYLRESEERKMPTETEKALGRPLPAFTIEHQERNVVLIRFPEECLVRMTRRHQEELGELVQTHNKVLYDLSVTKSIYSNWLRWLNRLTLLAESMGKSMYCTGMSDAVSRNTDTLALKDSLKMVPTETKDE